MDDEPVTGPKSLNPDDRNGAPDPSKSLDGELTAEAVSGREPQLRLGATNGVIDSGATAVLPENDKGDSEAETVVLSGQEGGSDHNSTRAIKLEEATSEPEGDRLDIQAVGRDNSSGNAIDRSRRSSLKRKRGKDDAKGRQEPDGLESSALSSTTSSPVPQAHSSKSSDSGSDCSRSSPPIDDAKGENGKLRKQRAGHEKKSSHNKSTKHGSVDGHERRETRSATHCDELSRRSESPPARTKGRARSIQSSVPKNTTKRKKPAPLNVDRRRKASEDVHVDSDDSSSAHSHHRLQKLNSVDGLAMSPAKISHKKNRDRNGRTLLARACTQGYEEAERWVKERPQDIDTPDNAGNTPLQIASLAGQDEVVELLLDAGCDTACRNIDLDTPLIDAVENSHFAVVKLLLKAGVDPRQRNAKGQEPLELVDIDDEDGEVIRSALIQARRDSDVTRRQSEDHRHHGTRDIDTPPAHPMGASPTESHRSPPPVSIGGRKRTARSVPTKDALLWVNPTPQRLREEAGKGNIEIVDHILRMRPEADIRSVLAAVKGGHDDVLGLMMALASPEPDPEPLSASDCKPGFATPLLAAIGRGNLDIIHLLLAQPGFDPTRRLFKDLTYPQLSEERQGPEWEEEHRMLQKAYDEHLKNGGRRSNTSSPRKTRGKRLSAKRDSPDPSSLPHESRKVRRANPPIKEDSDTEVKRRPSYQGTAVKLRNGGQEASAAVPERISGRLGPPKSKTADARPGSDATFLGLVRTDSIKPKRKLMSGNELKTDQEAKRKAKTSTDMPPDSIQNPPKRKSRQSFSNHDRPRNEAEEAILSGTQAKKASSEEPARTKEDPGKKRLRVSVSPQASRSDLGEGVKKKKRQRVDSLGNATSQDTERAVPASSAASVNMIESQTAVTSLGQGAAPVAFMGAPITSPATQSPTGVQLHPAVLSPLNSPNQIRHQSPEPENTVLQVADLETEQEAEALRIKTERDQEEELKREHQAMIEREEAAYKARLEREANEALLDAQRQAEEAARREQLEREAEEARIAKVKREEELQCRRAEDEKQRKEEQERRRREREERENLRRIRQQQEEERARMEALPNGLRRAAEVGTEQARDRKEITKWLPLRTVTTKDLDSNCERYLADEQWIANIQAAPILANQDLELSQCKPRCNGRTLLPSLTPE